MAAPPIYDVMRAVVAGRADRVARRVAAMML